jgi:hypothetical protein
VLFAANQSLTSTSLDAVIFFVLAAWKVSNSKRSSKRANIGRVPLAVTFMRSNNKSRKTS